MISYKPIKTQINNGTLSGMKAMPQKDITSDGSSDFSAARHNYAESYTTNYTPSQWKQKKFIGGNRDASSVVARRRATEIGVGSLNASGESLSFTTTRDINTTNDALRRVRGGGYVVPPKSRG